MNGLAAVNLECGVDEYVKENTTITEDCDTGIELVVTGSVNTGAVGSSTIRYNATDASNNAATQILRSVNVVDTTAPNVTCTEVVSINVNDTLHAMIESYSDACEPNPTVIDGFIYEQPGCYEGVTNVTDGAGHTVDCEFTVAVFDPDGAGYFESPAG